MASKPQLHQLDPIGRLEAILPQLEKIAKVYESAEDKARKEVERSIFKINNCNRVKDFEAFHEQHDPVLFDTQDNTVFCKQCYHYVISHSISKKGGKFYVSASQPCSYPLTGRG